jgi:hypothetical protein
MEKYGEKIRKNGNVTKAGGSGRVAVETVACWVPLERAENNASNGGEIIDIGELLTEVRMALETVEKYGEKNMENASGTKASGSGWVAVDVGGVGHRWKERMETHRMVVESLTLDG